MLEQFVVAPCIKYTNMLGLWLVVEPPKELAGELNQLVFIKYL